MPQEQTASMYSDLDHNTRSESNDNELPEESQGEFESESETSSSSSDEEFEARGTNAAVTTADVGTQIEDMGYDFVHYMVGAIVKTATTTGDSRKIDMNKIRRDTLLHVDTTERDMEIGLKSRDVMFAELTTDKLNTIELGIGMINPSRYEPLPQPPRRGLLSLMTFEQRPGHAEGDRDIIFVNNNRNANRVGGLAEETGSVEVTQTDVVSEKKSKKRKKNNKKKENSKQEQTLQGQVESSENIETGLKDSMETEAESREKKIQEGLRDELDAMKAQFDASEARSQEIEARFQEREAWFQEREAKFQESEARFQEREARFQEREARFQESEASFQASEEESRETKEQLAAVRRELETTKEELEATQLQVAENAEAQDLVNTENVEAFTEIIRSVGIDWSESAVLSAICLRTLLDRAQARTAEFIGIAPNWAKDQIDAMVLKKAGKVGSEAEVKVFRELSNNPKALEILATPSSSAPARWWGNKYAHTLPPRAEMEKIVHSATFGRKLLSNDEQDAYMKLLAVVFPGAYAN
ncbi:hypothetical protein D9613_006649 [Agrocybe pediades]|uniref:Uncharacterized protein n=1 Tax=Agrocybe pediades TaxID=84607 RepID=A0A8H4QI23_9AGAR|nr:hypothetical protein D9613_006649 [Agrocybe pediades]